MTTDNPDHWSLPPGMYVQLPVLNPPSGQNANNARYAVWHLGRPLVLEVFPGGHWNARDDDPEDDGRYDRGVSETVVVYGHIQPLTYNNRDGSQDLGTRRGGDYIEGEVVLHLDSHQPENIQAAAQSTFFDDHIYFSPGESAPTGYQNFAMLIHWAGRKWKPRTVQEHWEGSDEEVSGEVGAVYRVVLCEYTDVNQERKATPQQETTYYGPEGP